MRSVAKDRNWNIGVSLLSLGLVFMAGGVLAFLLHLVPETGLLEDSLLVWPIVLGVMMLLLGEIVGSEPRISPIPDTLLKNNGLDSIYLPVYPEDRYVESQKGVTLRGRFLKLHMGIQSAPNTWNSTDIAMYVTPIRPQAGNTVHVTLQRKPRTKSPPFGLMEGDLPWVEVRNLAFAIAKKGGRVCVCTDLLGSVGMKEREIISGRGFRLAVVAHGLMPEDITNQLPV